MKRFPLCLVAVLCAIATLSVSAADSRGDFLKLIKRPRVPLAPEVEQLPTTNGLLQFHFSFAADAAQRVPGVLLKSADAHGRRPVVIALHGTGGTKQSVSALCRKLAD